jgi:glycosyltransferase involved in cell wall biosynthesis
MNSNSSTHASWVPGSAPIAVVMISLNEGHNLRQTLENLKGFAQEVFLVDSYSVDDTIDIALEYGIHVVQRKFTGFGDQWNFALSELSINAPWTMKLDPDERLTDEFKVNLVEQLRCGESDAIRVSIRLNFMNKPLPINLNMLRIWRTGKASMSDVLVNEHIKVDGIITDLDGAIEHYDSPNLEHWLNKQNRYTTMEAIWQFQEKPLADSPQLFGNSLQRRMWLKRYFWKIPGRYTLLFLYNYFVLGAWKAGKVGFIWARLRSDVYRLWEYKYYEIRKTGALPVSIPSRAGYPDSRVKQSS